MCSTVARAQGRQRFSFFALCVTPTPTPHTSKQNLYLLLLNASNLFEQTCGLVAVAGTHTHVNAWIPYFSLSRVYLFQIGAFSIQNFRDTFLKRFAFEIYGCVSDQHPLARTCISIRCSCSCLCELWMHPTIEVYGNRIDIWRKKKKKK